MPCRWQNFLIENDQLFEIVYTRGSRPSSAVEAFGELLKKVHILWMGLEGLTLSEISQAEKDQYCRISFMWNLKNKTWISKQKQNQTYKFRELIVAREGDSGMGRMGEGQ